jgi:hypothetical protein
VEVAYCMSGCVKNMLPLTIDPLSQWAQRGIEDTRTEELSVLAFSKVQTQALRVCNYVVWWRLYYWPDLRPPGLGPSPGCLTGWRSSSVSPSVAPPHCPCSPGGCSTATDTRHISIGYTLCCRSYSLHSYPWLDRLTSYIGKSSNYLSFFREL